jgi:hypothetical protein
VNKQAKSAKQISLALVRKGADQCHRMRARLFKNARIYAHVSPCEKCVKNASKFQINAKKMQKNAKNKK